MGRVRSVPGTHGLMRMQLGKLRANAAQFFADFFRLEAASGILLIAAALIALVCANTPLNDLYEAFREVPVEVGIGELRIDKPLLLWINDGLMAMFFLLVALEIKRETLGGQLSNRDQLMLPLVCAAAGVAVPAIIYWALNRGDATALRGWAIPTATDIAFALGILALLGSRVPLGMKLLLSTIAVVDDLIAIVILAVFYTHELSFVALGWAAALGGWAVPPRRDIALALGCRALLGSRVPLGMKLLLSTIAVVDDLIAIVISAVFYTHDMSFVALGWAAAAVAVMGILNWRGVTALTPYLLLGVVLWVCVLKSGVHATLAGVVTGLMIPHVNRHNDLDDATEHSPVETLEHALPPWVASGLDRK